MTNGIRFSPSFVISLALTLTVWVIFYPGILSADSLNIYHAAQQGSFTDKFSPLITIMLFLFLKVGGSIGLLILPQCLLGFLGVRRLVFAIQDLFSGGQTRKEWAASLVIILLSSSLTPMPIYFVTFWLDTWLVIFLLWILALLLELANEIPTDNFRESWFKIILLIALITFAMLARLNSSILYPALGLGLFIILSHKPISHKVRRILALCPLMLFLLFTIFQYSLFGVKHAHTERVFFALDLASMITHNSSICQTLSLQSCILIEGKIDPEFVAGNGAIDRTMNQGLSTMEPAYIALILSPSLPHELWLAATHYPWTYGAVKVLNFWDYIRPRDRYYYQSFMHPNNLNLSFNPRFELVRSKLFVLLHTVYEHPILKFVSFVHLPWIVINLIGIAFCFMYKKQLEQLRILGAILFIPATYYISYLIALTASDFRYMYPSTLVMQVIVTGFIATLPNSRNRAK